MVEGNAVDLGPRGEVGMVGDDEWYLGLELSRVPAPQEVYEAVVVAGDQYSHPLWRVGVGESPVHAVPAGQRSEGAGELVAFQAESLALNLKAHEEGAGVADVLVGGEDVTVVHRDERGDRRDQALLVGAGDQESQVVA